MDNDQAWERYWDRVEADLERKIAIVKALKQMMSDLGKDREVYRVVCSNTWPAFPRAKLA